MIIGCGLGENYNTTKDGAWKNAFEKLSLNPSN
jgi:hypothetical protein